LQKTSVQDISEGKYRIPASAAEGFSTADSNSQRKAVSGYVYSENDSIYFRTYSGQPITKLLYPVNNKSKNILLLRPSFDFDVFTTPFKFRPALADMPAQFNTSFNGSFYLGYRVDRFKIQQKNVYDGIIREKITKSGIGIGAFAGIGSAFINPKVMNNAIDYEYDALAIDYGIAVLFGFRNINTGLSIGFDFLTDKNQKQWLYQHRPWFGIFIGLNLN
jgi:hypothetical protein